LGRRFSSSMKRFLITGGCGYIGSHTCFTLLDSGYELTILDSNINSSEESLKNLKKLNYRDEIDFKEKLKFIKGDIRDERLLTSIFENAFSKKKKIDGVIHFAGLKSVSESMQKTLNYWENNVGGSITLLKVMEKYNCRKIIFSSSAAIYRSKNNKLLKESDIIEPYSPYGETKAAIEKILNSLYLDSRSNWQIVNLRYFNPIGAHPSGILGENPLGPPENLLPHILLAASGKNKNLKIFGNDWETPDGTCIRDFIHILDLANAHKASIDLLLTNESNLHNINIGTGMGTSVLQLAKVFQKVNSCKFPITFTERRQGDIPFSVANNSFALEKLEWVPLRTLEDMCLDSWNWFKNNQ